MRHRANMAIFVAGGKPRIASPQAPAFAVDKSVEKPRLAELYRNIALCHNGTNNERQKGRDMQEAVFKGASGKLYRFAVLRPDGAFPEGPAVYAFARPAFGGRSWAPLFLSRTANLAVRMTGHERWEEAQLLGATHVLLLSFHDRAEREAAEADLADALRPVMNDDEPAATEEAPVAAGQVVHFFPPIRLKAAV